MNLYIAGAVACLIGVVVGRELFPVTNTIETRDVGSMTGCFYIGEAVQDVEDHTPVPQDFPLTKMRAEAACGAKP